MPPRRLTHLFRHFCQISGKHDHGVNNANLKLTVMGGTILLRKNAVQMDGLPRNNLGFRFALGGWTGVFRCGVWCTHTETYTCVHVCTHSDIHVCVVEY